MGSMPNQVGKQLIVKGGSKYVVEGGKRAGVGVWKKIWHNMCPLPSAALSTRSYLRRRAGSKKDENKVCWHGCDGAASDGEFAAM